MFKETLILAAATAAFGAFTVRCTPALAHDWYDAACCHDRDCAPIERISVEQTPDGYRVYLDDGDHPMVRDPFIGFIRYDSPNVRPSQDGNFHACVIVSGETGTTPVAGLRCLYVPLDG